MARLKDDGKVREIGVTNFDVGQLERIKSISRVSSIQPPYSLIARGIEDEILPYCLAEGIGVIVYSPMQSGLLSGKMTRERIASLPENDWRKTISPEFQEPKLTENLELVFADARSRGSWRPLAGRSRHCVDASAPCGHGGDRWLEKSPSKSDEAVGAGRA